MAGILERQFLEAGNLADRVAPHLADLLHLVGPVGIHRNLEEQDRPGFAASEDAEMPHDRQ